MAITTKKPALSATSNKRKHLKIIVLLLVLPLILITPQISKPTYSQGDGYSINISVANGYPEKLPADGKSTTVLEATIEDCSFGGPIDSNGSFFVNYSTYWSKTGTDDPGPPTISLQEGNLPKEPPKFLLTAGSTPGNLTIDVEISYCPPGAIALMGVCSDPAYANVKCHGIRYFGFYDPEDSSEDIGLADNPDSASSEQASSEQAASEQATSEQARSEQATSEQAQSEQTRSEDEGSSEITRAELYQDLEEFLAGEGITAPTPRQIGTTGIAITTLLAGWLVLNQMAGTSAEQSLEVIKAWKNGERPPIGAEVDLPADLGDGDVGLEGDLPKESPDPAEEEQSTPLERTPVQEGGEDRLLRGIKDVQDLDDAVKQTRKDFESFQNKVPDQIKNSATWKKHVAPKLKKAEDFLKKGEMDKARIWLDRAEKILEVRKDVDRELDHLPVEQREGVVRLVQALKAGAHVLSDIFNTTVIEPLKAAGSKLLPPEQAKRWKKTMDETGQALSDVGQGIPSAVVKGSKNITHGKIMEQAEQMSQDSSPEIRREAQQMKDLYKRDNVDHFDPWGKGTKKAKELWNKTMRAIFHDR
jgi:hypothetical protein